MEGRLEVVERISRLLPELLKLVVSKCFVLRWFVSVFQFLDSVLEGDGGTIRLSDFIFEVLLQVSRRKAA